MIDLDEASFVLNIAIHRVDLVYAGIVSKELTLVVSWKGSSWIVNKSEMLRLLKGIGKSVS